MPSKPIAAPRRAPSKSKLAVRDLSRELERVGRKHERAVDDEPEQPTPGRGVVVRVGRGKQRKGAGEMRRVTLYLPVPVADELEQRARRRRATFSIVASETLAEAFGITVEAAE